MPLNDAWGAPKFEDHCIFWIILSQNIGHIFCTWFCMVVNNNQVIWPAYNFFQQFFYWPFIMIYLPLELLWNKHILYQFLFTFLKIEGLVICNFCILVLGLIFDEVPPLLIFFISQYDFGLGCERDFCSLSREEGGGGAPSPLPGTALYTIYFKKYIYIYVIYICTYIYVYTYIHTYIHTYINTYIHTIHTYINKHTEWVRQPAI